MELSPGGQVYQEWNMTKAAVELKCRLATVAMPPRYGDRKDKTVVTGRKETRGRVPPE
jgi:hypothetical protein